MPEPTQDHAPPPFRCFGTGDPLYERYHDEEWGVPVRDERALFERVTLEAFQSGLSWITILRKREAFRAAFAGFDAETVADWGDPEVDRLLADAGIVRNRAKIEATLANARALRALHGRGGTLVELVWSHAPATPAPADGRRSARLPAQTPESKALAKALKKLPASASSARRPPTPPCRPAGSSTTTSRPCPVRDRLVSPLDEDGLLGDRCRRRSGSCAAPAPRT